MTDFNVTPVFLRNNGNGDRICDRLFISLGCRLGTTWINNM
ncbi:MULTISPECIES: hypothetical protein [unclassified Microcoleus]